MSEQDNMRKLESVRKKRRPSEVDLHVVLVYRISCPVITFGICFTFPPSVLRFRRSIGAETLYVLSHCISAGATP